MEIIKKGTLPSLRRHRATCPNCQCEFIFEEQEARFESHQRDGDFFKIKCPMPGCEHQVTKSCPG